jgi:hypothetical protein
MHMLNRPSDCLNFTRNITEHNCFRHVLTDLLYAPRILIPFKLAKTSPLSFVFISQRKAEGVGEQKHQLLHYLRLFWRMRRGIRPGRFCWISITSPNIRRPQLNSTGTYKTVFHAAVPYTQWPRRKGSTWSIFVQSGLTVAPMGGSVPV